LIWRKNKLSKKNINVKRVILFFIFIGFLFNSLGAMDWPCEDAILVNNFGANNRGKPVLGMIFDGGTDIKAVESGEVIFSRSRNDSRSITAASRLPSPLGFWTAIDHGDSLISIYSRYDEQTENNLVDKKAEIQKEQIIASPGTSGWSTRNGFYFLIFDRRERRWINPAMIITPRQEPRTPQIFSVELRNASGSSVDSRNVVQGRYTVNVNAAGGTGRAVPGVVIAHAPHRIVCSINGVEAGSLIFESYSARDGILMVTRNALVPAKQVYANSPFFEAAEVFLTRGQVTLEVIVQDITGASRSMSSRLIVN